MASVDFYASKVSIFMMDSSKMENGMDIRDLFDKMENILILNGQIIYA
jgi:hypothetical protein